MQREQHLLLRSMDECSVVAMECTPDRDLLLIQRSIHFHVFGNNVITFVLVVLCVGHP